MARKIRVTESELVSMIENIITTEKRDKNVIKLSEGDLSNIIKKVNEKINFQESSGKIDIPQVATQMEKLFAAGVWSNIERIVAGGKNPKATGDIIQSLMDRLAKSGAKIPSADAMVIKNDAQALAKGDTAPATAPGATA